MNEQNIMIRLYDGLLLSHKKEHPTNTGTIMDGSQRHHPEWNKVGRKKNNAVGFHLF